ncbi:hypothetical protein BJX70DRAFT_409813 [Aspergillus crustosus]
MSGYTQIQHYSGHKGHPVVLEERIVPDWSPEPYQRVPIQVYSLAPLDPDHGKLRQYLIQGYQNEVMPLFEIYSYCPSDAFDCIEHHRHEIAYRKQQHKQSADPSSLPPLIPQYFRGAIPLAFCVLIRSQSYRLGRNDDTDKLDEAGEGPDFLYFNRCLSSTRSHVDQVQRGTYLSSGLDPEAFELSVERVDDQAQQGGIIMGDILPDATGPDDRMSLKYAMDVDEGVLPPSTQPSEDQLHAQLDQQFIDDWLALTRSVRVTHDGKIVTVSNTPDGAEPDLQYVIFAAFLRELSGNDASTYILLEATARLFTASLLSQLPTPKTVNLKFSIPESSLSPFSGVRSAYKAILSNKANGLPHGALQIFSADEKEPPARYRVAPTYPHDSTHAARRDLATPCRVFAVVLDRANFVAEAGVYFYKADVDYFKQPQLFCDGICPDDTVVWRCIGMREVARRLGMIAVEEENGL